MEQNETMNAANSHADGTAPLEVGTRLGVHRARGIRQIIFQSLPAHADLTLRLRAGFQRHRVAYAPNGHGLRLLLSFKNTNTEHKCSVFRSVLLTSNKLLI